ncbi:hypothetical protein [Selenomonas sputigena]|jgi:hypothetical protein|uniref:Uncharacterized protein n=1 Tax=Selenomonas sputigena (strain ATCC 35185 / DSM 20758 / CCUG 44933 / VPI D19B-28) TaxID=546271 RepID=C9LUA3_SELS3|nr:hypothetical protein [Selenomonas sputigena]AEC00271.1 hypothetical protein Selsp_1312 [Selenomonas sputigena ATCC 35185]EEX77634.1 hypothetical protein SELSPUOL_00910 [Selenomonas sputigena ATCC 35185]
MENEYLAKFDADGRRETTVVRGIHYTTKEERQAYIDDGYIPISDEDYQHYIGNRGAGDNGTGYIRDIKTGKPVSAPPAPAVDEEPQELPVDPERLAVYEAMAAQDERLAAQAERIAALEAALKTKGGDSK